jgi:hypothetical protein
LEKAQNTWGGKTYLPHKVVAAVHYVTLHVCTYYDTWCALNGRRVERTSKQIGKMRLEGERFLMVPSDDPAS